MPGLTFHTVGDCLRALAVDIQSQVSAAMGAENFFVEISPARVADVILILPVGLSVVPSDWSDVDWLSVLEILFREQPFNFRDFPEGLTRDAEKGAMGAADIFGMCLVLVGISFFNYDHDELCHHRGVCGGDGCEYGRCSRDGDLRNLCVQRIVRDQWISSWVGESQRKKDFRVVLEIFSDQFQGLRRDTINENIIAPARRRCLSGSYCAKNITKFPAPAKIARMARLLFAAMLGVGAVFFLGKLLVR